MPDDYQVPQGIWKALFEFAQNLGANDPVNQTPSTVQQMSEENRKWLEEALNSYAKESDPVRLMKIHLENLMALELHNPSREDVDKGVEELGHLNDLCTYLDNATDFHKIGGFRILIPLLASSSPIFRANAAELIGDLAQNHSYCQEKLREVKMLTLLLEILDSDTDVRVRVKALYAISSLIRSNATLEQDFVKADGLAYLTRALSSDEQRLQTKTLFLLTHLLTKYADCKKLACEMGMVDQFVSLLGQMNDQGREHLTAALLALVENNPQAVDQCKRDDLALKEILQQRIDEISNSPDCQEELENCRKLMQICWSDKK